MNIIPANFLDSSQSDRIIFASSSIFKFLGIKMPENIGNREYWSKDSFQIDTLLIDGKIFTKGASFKEINKISAYDFDVIIPIQELGEKALKKDINNIFLMVANGFNAPQISKKARELLNFNCYAVRIWTENSIASEHSTASEYEFTEVLDIYSFALFALSFFLFYLIINIMEKERKNELSIRLLYGDNFHNIFIRNLIDLFIIISVSLIFCFIAFLVYYLLYGKFIFKYDFQFITVLTICTLLLSAYITIANSRKNVAEVMSESIEASSKTTFIFPILIIGFGFITCIFIFLSASEKQIRKIVERKVSPYENNILFVENITKGEIYSKIDGSDFSDLEFSENIVKINFKPEQFAKNAIKLIQKYDIEFDDELIGNSIRNYYSILSYYKSLYLIFGLISTLNVIAIFIYIIYNLRFEIAVMKMLGANKINILLFINSFVLKILILSTPIAWMSAFFMMSSWQGKFRSRASFLIFDYVEISFSAAILILGIGTFSALQLYQRNIVEDIKIK